VAGAKGCHSRFGRQGEGGDEVFLEGQKSLKKVKGKRSLFYKKVPQKIFDHWCPWHRLSPAALLQTPTPSGQKFFAELFYKKATSSLFRSIIT
jgi:hypothetical protein